MTAAISSALSIASAPLLPAPVAFGVLTVDTLEQALERAATGAGNKGGEAMESALEMAAVMARL